MSVALSLMVAAQQAGENVAWVSGTRSTFYAIDAHNLDLAALPIIRAPDSQRAGRAVSHLLRSGAFGLVVLDLSPFPPAERELALPLQSRLSGLAQRHGAVFLALTEKTETAPSLGSLVSLHGRVTRRPAPMHPDSDGHLRVAVEVVATKDKRHGPGWRHIDHFKAPDGLS